MRSNTAATVLVACAVSLAGCQGAGTPISPSGLGQAGQTSGSIDAGATELAKKPGGGPDPTFLVTVSFGGLWLSGETQNLFGSQLVIGMGRTGQTFPISTVAGVDTSDCFPNGSEGAAPGVISDGTADALDVAVRFTAPDSMGRDKRYDLRLAGDPAGDWLPGIGDTTTLVGPDWDVKKVQGKDSSEPCAASADAGQSQVAWEVSVTRIG